MHDFFDTQLSSILFRTVLNKKSNFEDQRLLPPYGGNDGVEFVDDNPHIIVRIDVMYCDRWIRAIVVFFADGTATKHGNIGSASKTASFEMSAEEYITQVYTQLDSSGRYIQQLSICTSTYRTFTVDYDAADMDETSLIQPFFFNGKVLSGFTGRYDEQGIIALGFLIDTRQ
jgi:hypothetical protein